LPLPLLLVVLLLLEGRGGMGKQGRGERMDVPAWSDRNPVVFCFLLRVP
jgi:hypothetical protein